MKALKNTCAAIFLLCGLFVVSYAQPAKPWGYNEYLARSIKVLERAEYCHGERAPKNSANLNSCIQFFEKATTDHRTQEFKIAPQNDEVRELGVVFNSCNFLAYSMKLKLLSRQNDEPVNSDLTEHIEKCTGRILRAQKTSCVGLQRMGHRISC